MSSSVGAIVFPDDEIWYVVYFGTACLMQNVAFPSRADLRFEKGMAYEAVDRCLKLGHGEPVVVTNDEDDVAPEARHAGPFWNGKACRECHTFLGPYEYGWPNYGYQAAPPESYVPSYKTIQEARDG